MSSPVARQEERIRHNEDKWTKTLWSAGWTGIPSIILVHQKQLGLDPLDLNILLQIAKHWWYEDRLPRPSKRSLAEAIGCHPRTVQRRVEALERSGLIKRVPRSNKVGGQGANEYDFSGLIERTTPYAESFLEKRERRRADDATAARRRGLRVVRSSSKKAPTPSSPTSAARRTPRA